MSWKLVGLNCDAYVDASSVAGLAKGAEHCFLEQLERLLLFLECFMLLLLASIPRQYYVLLNEIPMWLQNFDVLPLLIIYYCTKTLAMRSIWSNADFLLL